MQWSIDAIRATPEIDEIVIALPPGAEAPEGTIGVPGGAVRSASVAAALGASTGDPVVVHDAARPLAQPALFSAVLAELAAHAGTAGAIAAAPVTDTIKEASGERTVTATLDRSRLWAVQTPQAFRRAALERALDVGSKALEAATDDAWLVERAGGSVRIVPAPAENLKITTYVDLRLAELLISER